MPPKFGEVCFPTKGQTNCPTSNSNNSNSNSSNFGGNTGNYPTGGSHGGGSSNNQEESKDNYSGGGGGSGGINTHGGSYAYGYDYAQGKHAYNISFKSIMDRTSSPAHGYLVPDKTINLRNNNLNDGEIGVLVGNLQYQRLDLDVFDVSNNKIGFGGVENLFYGLRFDNTLAGRYIVTMNFSNNLIGDDGAKYMADSLAMGRFPNLKSLNISNNQITGTGYGYLAKGLEVVSQDLKIVFEIVKGFSKDALKASMKGMLFIAKNNGISTKETLTTDETIEHCKNGVANVGLNIGSGVAKCTITPLKYFNLKDVTLQDIGLDILSYAIPQVKVPIVFTCITQSTFFSVVDEEFSNCLVGVDSLLNE